MKCEVLICEDAEAALKEGLRLEWWSQTTGRWVPNGSVEGCSEFLVYRLAPEQPVPPGDLTWTEAVELRGRDEVIQELSKQGNWVDVLFAKEPECFGKNTPYRRKPETKRVPLGPEDVQAGCAVKCGDSSETYCIVAATFTVVVIAHGDATLNLYSWQDLMRQDWRVFRDGAFQPCSKEVES